MPTDTQSSQYLFSAIKSLEHRASALQQITEFVRSLDDVDQVLDKLLRKVTELAGADAGVIALADPKSAEFQFVSLHWASASPLEAAEREKVLKVIRVNLSDGIIGQVYTAGEAHIVSNVAQSSQFRKDISDMVKYEIQNLIAVPLEI